MTFQLRYGDGDTVCVDLPPEVVGDYSRPKGEPVENPTSAVESALDDPLNFPALAKATVPGDRVVLAVDRGVPQLPAVIAGVVERLLASSALPHEITIVLADNDDLKRNPLEQLPLPVQDAIHVEVHDPSHMDRMAYLAASRDGKPIYFNRTIFDADVVLPIGVLRLDGSWGYMGVHGCLFPTFSDSATQDRFRTPRSDWRAHLKHSSKEAEEAAWLLGVQFTLQITPGPGDSMMHVLAGDAHAVAERGQQLYESAWKHHAARKASLVVATIEGTELTQTWDNVTRALLAASEAVTDGGSIVLCTKLQQPPGTSVQRLAEMRDGEELIRSLKGDRSTDAFTARLLARTMDRAQIFLLSLLEEETVEDLGLGHVSCPDEVTRLSRRHDSCILVGNAQHALVATEE
jgi:nickel-dependent lactate racemase